MARLLYPSATPLPRYRQISLRQLPDLRQLSYIRIKYPLRERFLRPPPRCHDGSREARNLARLRHHAVCELVPLQFEHQSATVKIQFTFQFRMNNPNKTNTFTFQINRCGLPRMRAGFASARNSTSFSLPVGRERIQDRLSNHRNQRSLLPGSSALRNGYRKSHRLTSDPDECPTVPEYLVRNADRFRKCAHGSADGSGCTPRLPAGRSTEKDALLTFQQRSGWQQ